VKRFLALAAAAIAIAALLFGIDYYRHRWVRHNSDLVWLLPPGDLNVIFADIATLRKAGLLGVLSNIKVAPDKSYDAFLAETGFDYTRDLDAIAIGIDPQQTFLIGRGRFRWDRFKAFAKSHNGTCESAACRAPSSTPGRWVNFISIQPDVIGVAISQSETAADDLRPPGRRVQGKTPQAPVWASLAHQLLTHPITLPLPFQIFAISMQEAQSVLVSAELHSINLKAHFLNAAAAATARTQLELQTKRLSTALAQGSEKPDPASLATLLTAGSFTVVGTDVLGRWPLYPEFLKAIQ
jgi:hypothetical protein